MRYLLAALLLGACHVKPGTGVDTDTDAGTCPRVGDLLDAPPCVSGTCPELVELTCDQPDVTWQTCRTGAGTTYTVVVDGRGTPTRLFHDAAGAVVAVAVTGSFGVGCPDVRWFGERLDDCVVTGTREPECDTDPGDTDTDVGDTDVPPAPTTIFFTPLESAPVCVPASGGTPAYCPELSSFDLCAVPDLVFAAEGTCTLPGARRVRVKRWVHGAGPSAVTSSVYDDVGAGDWTSGPILAYAERAGGRPRSWWGEDLTACDAQIAVFPPLDCTPDDTDVEDSDTDVEDTAAGLDTDGGWPIAWTEPGELVVTELMVDPLGCADYYGEIVELRNVGPHGIDLHGLVLDDGARSGRITVHHLLPSGAYAVAMPGEASGGGCLAMQLLPDVWYSRTVDGQGWGPQLLDEGGVLTLKRFDGVVLEQVDTTTFRFDPQFPDVVAPPGHTVQLRADREVSHAVDDPADWCLGVDPLPTDTDSFGSPGGPATCGP